MSYFERKIKELAQTDSNFAAFLEKYRQTVCKYDIDNYAYIEMDMEDWADENISEE